MNVPTQARDHVVTPETDMHIQRARWNVKFPMNAMMLRTVMEIVQNALNLVRILTMKLLVTKILKSASMEDASYQYVSIPK